MIMKTNVYIVAVAIIDHDQLGEEEIKLLIENTRYPNHCMNPKVLEVDQRSVDWHDEHPLNNRNTQMEELCRLFNKNPPLHVKSEEER